MQNIEFSEQMYEELNILQIAVEGAVHLLERYSADDFAAGLVEQFYRTKNVFEQFTPKKGDHHEIQ